MTWPEISVNSAKCKNLQAHTVFRFAATFIFPRLSRSSFHLFPSPHYLTLAGHLRFFIVTIILSEVNVRILYPLRFFHPVVSYISLSPSPFLPLSLLLSLTLSLSLSLSPHILSIFYKLSRKRLCLFNSLCLYSSVCLDLCLLIIH